MRRAIAGCWLLLLAAIAAGQEIRLDAPTEPIQPREYCQILVSGLADAELAGATIDWSPREGTTLMPARMWGGQPFLLFSARQPGKYSITVSVHAWRTNLDAAIDAARRAAIDTESLQLLTDVQRQLAGRYPPKSGSCVLEVAGGPPPPPPPGKLARALILLDSASPNEEQGLQLNLLRNDKPWSKLIEILETRQQDENEQPAALVAAAIKYLDGRPLPRLIGLGSDGAFCFDVELPQSAEKIKATLIERGLKP